MEMTTATIHDTMFGQIAEQNTLADSVRVDDTEPCRDGLVLRKTATGTGSEPSDLCGVARCVGRSQVARCCGWEEEVGG